jgi:Domain of unknown function (4846)
MAFLLKYLITAVFFFSTSCKIENPTDFKTEITPDTIPISETSQVLSSDSIAHLKYSWKDEINPDQTLKNRIKTPESYHRIENEKGSFADWLRYLPSKEANSKVHLYNGELKSNQSVHAAIVDIDVGKRDLQQCADAVMRLRAEYFYGKKEFSKIHFNYTSGDKVAFDDWMRGKKPVISGNSVHFSSPSNTIDYSYSNFQKYLIAIFSYAGTASLSKEMKKVTIENMQIGDVFIQGGFPGHAIIVVDMVVNESGQNCFLLAQSYMPAQEIHVLKNFNDPELSPWYPTDFGESLRTPEWTFSKTDLKRFGE